MNLEYEIRGTLGVDAMFHVVSNSDGLVTASIDGGEASTIGTIEAANPAPDAGGHVRSDHGKGNKVPPDAVVYAATGRPGSLDIGMYSTFETVPEAIKWLIEMAEVTKAGPPAE